VSASLSTLLARALARRAPLRISGETTAFRWVNGVADGIPGLTVDLFGSVAVANLYEVKVPELPQALWAAHRLQAVYVKSRPREAGRLPLTEREARAPPTPECGEAVEAVDVQENGLRFRIRPGAGLAVGLYLDMREARGWLRAKAQGRRVLNCFAYTCAFGVAARAGGAVRVVNVDLSRRSLEWGEENGRLNGQIPTPEEHLSGDVFQWLRRFRKRGERFDVVVLDPPGFARSREGTFSVSRDWPGLVAEAVSVLEADGLLLAACNVAALPARRFDAAVEEGLRQGGRAGHVVARPEASPVDFPLPPGEEGPLKVRAVRVGVLTSSSRSRRK